MVRKTRRDVIATLGTAATVGVAGCSSSGDGGGATTDATESGGTTGSEATTEATGTESTTTTVETADVRVAHFSPDAPDVDVYVDGDRVLSGVAFGTVGDYLPVPVGTRSLRITAAGDPDTVAFEGDLEVAPGSYTVAAVGELGDGDTEFRPLVLADDNDDPGEGTARVRLLHASPDAPAVDVTLASSGDALYDDVAFGESGYVEVPAGTYTLQVRGDTEADDGDVVAEFTVELAGGTVYTAVAGGYLTPGDDPADRPFDLAVTADAGAGGGGVVDPARVRVAHFSPDAPDVDVYVDDSRVLADVPFRAVSDYLRLVPGTYTVAITAAGDRDTVVFEDDLTLESGPYTVAAIGELTSDDTEFRPLVLDDDELEPGSDSDDARVRVVHASPDAPAVDVTIGSMGAIADGIAFGESDGSLLPAADYTLQVREETETNDGDVVGEFSANLSAERSYTAFALGYLTPGDDPGDAGFDIAFAVDGGT